MSPDFGYKGVAALIDDLPVPTRLNERDTFCGCRAFHDFSLLLVPPISMGREKSPGSITGRRIRGTPTRRRIPAGGSADQGAQRSGVASRVSDIRCIMMFSRHHRAAAPSTAACPCPWASCQSALSTCASLWMKSQAHTAPIPLAPPVMRATCPWRLFMKQNNIPEKILFKKKKRELI